MKLHPLLRFLLSTSLIIIIIHCNPVEPHQDPRYEACNSRTTSCGNSSLKISYPFWGVGWPQYRGQPGFNLSCDGRNFKINILSQTYNVIDINYNASTLKIVNEELMMHGECPGTEDYHNTTLNLALFNYTSSVRNATLFYRCPDSKSIRNAPISFTCPGKYKNSLSFFVLTEAWEHELESICGVQIYVPVLKSASIDLSENPRIADVLKGGFEVKWVIEQGYCQECYMSGGCCEYNMSVGNSTCYCKSGSYPTVCPHSETPSMLSNSITESLPFRYEFFYSSTTKTGIGAASGFLLLMITFVVFARGEKNYHTSSTLPSQSTAQLSSATRQC